MAEEIKANPADGQAAPKSQAKIDLASFAGLAVALGGILGGLLMEGGRLKDVAQFTAAMIVLGGTTGAVLLSTPLPIARGAVRRFAGVFRDHSRPPEEVMEEVLQYAAKARKNGLVSLEQEANLIQDPFLKKALNLAVDGTDLQELRKMLELEIEMEEQHVEAEAKVFESAGGYAPTVGIIGAVLGLIQVMKNLANIEEVGHGIAVAFVATVYGVGSANLIFLPVASKIKARFTSEIHRKQLIVEAVAGIVEGLNPKLIRLKLEAYLPAARVKKPVAAREKAMPKGAEAPLKA